MTTTKDMDQAFPPGLARRPPTAWDAVCFWFWQFSLWAFYALLTLIYIPWAVAMHLVILALLLITLPALYWRIPRKVHLYVYVVIVMVPGKFLWYNLFRYNRRKGKVWDYEMGQPKPVQALQRHAIDTSQKVNAQSASPLFTKLPPEIRMNIYRHSVLLDNESVLILGWSRTEPKKSKDIQIRGYPCPMFPCIGDNSSESDTVTSARVLAAYYKSLDIRDNPKFHMGLAWLRTCKQIYSEAKDLIYTLPTFTFMDLHRPPFFLRTVLPDRLALIRSVHIIYDQSRMMTRSNHVACSTAKFQHKMGQCSFCNPIHWFNGINQYMTGLKDIRVHIFIRKDQRMPDMGKTWIARMLELQTGPNGLRNMQIEVLPSFINDVEDRDLMLDEEEYLNKANKLKEQLHQRMKREVDRYVAKHHPAPGPMIKADGARQSQDLTLRVT